MPEAFLYTRRCNPVRIYPEIMVMVFVLFFCWPSIVV